MGSDRIGSDRIGSDRIGSREVFTVCTGDTVKEVVKKSSPILKLKFSNVSRDRKCKLTEGTKLAGNNFRPPRGLQNSSSQD
jgi:hypothetical protein